jgi:hypothetical protein
MTVTNSPRPFIPYRIPFVPTYLTQEIAEQYDDMWSGGLLLEDGTDYAVPGLLILEQQV